MAPANTPIRAYQGYLRGPGSISSTVFTLVQVAPKFETHPNFTFALVFWHQVVLKYQLCQTREDTPSLLAFYLGIQRQKGASCTRVDAVLSYGKPRVLPPVRSPSHTEIGISDFSPEPGQTSFVNCGRKKVFLVEDYSLG